VVEKPDTPTQISSDACLPGLESVTSEKRVSDKIPLEQASTPICAGVTDKMGGAGEGMGVSDVEGVEI